MANQKKVVLIGLAGVNPDLIYEWREELPNIDKLMKLGLYGKISSCIPPLMPPVWSCVLSGKNPGKFGYWDFYYRNDYNYGKKQLVNSKLRDERVNTLYKILSQYGKKVAIINVPVTYPPPEINNGYAVSCFMTPNLEEQFTHPQNLQKIVKEKVGEYIIDYPVCKMTHGKIKNETEIDRIREMDWQRFELTKHFIKEGCDFVFSVITGTDTVGHLFYHYMDKNHVKYNFHPEFSNAIKEHYMFCDTEIGEILNLVDDKTSIVIMSDSGIQRLDGRINLNEWLLKQGYLKVKNIPESPTPLNQVDIEWSQTKAWAEGIIGELYLNVKGREPQGVVEPREYITLLQELSEKLKGIKDEKGKMLNTKTFVRKDIHSGEFGKFGPDLFVYFDNCHWNISNCIGYNSIYSYELSDIPCYGTHGPQGLLVMVGPEVPCEGETFNVDILDIPPTILTLMGVSVPEDFEGKPVVQKKKDYSSREEEEVRKRLSRLGYLG